MKAQIWFNSSWKRWRFLKHSNTAEVNDQLLVIKKVDAWTVQNKNVGLVVEIRAIDFHDNSDVIRNGRKIGWIEKRSVLKEAKETGKIETMATSEYIPLSKAETKELYLRQEQLDDYADAAQRTMGNAVFPIHDKISSDDPDAEWNSYPAIDAELASRVAK